MVLELPEPYSLIEDPTQAPDWWPQRPADPRDGLPWARGSRHWAGDAFVGAPGGPALWLRSVVDGKGPPARMNAVDVCAGLVSGVDAPEPLVAEAREVCTRQAVIAANGYGSPLIEDGPASASERHRLLAAVVDAARRARAVPAALHLPAGNPLLEIMRDLGLAVGITDVYPTIVLAGSSIDDYLGALPHRRRIHVRREMRDMERGRGHVHVGLAAAPYLDIAAELVAYAHTNRGQHIEPAEVAASYARLLDACGDDIVLCVVEVEGVAAASACLIQGRTDLLLYSAGIRLPLARQVAGYFNAAYYLPIGFAYEKELRRIHLGPTGTRTKHYRGARFVPLLSAVPPACTPLMALLRATDEHMRRVLEGL